MKHILSFIAVLLFCSMECMGQEYRDVVYLKNGSVIKGFYTDFYTNDSLRMKTVDGGVLVCAFSDIERVAKEKVDIYVIHEKKKKELKYRPKGYAGYIDYTNSINTDDSRLRSNLLSTTHGYRFSRNVFLGAGVSYSTTSYSEKKIVTQYKMSSLVLYGNARYDILRRSVTPFVDARAGYSVFGNQGLYVAPSTGVDFCLTPKFGLYLSLGYRYFKFRHPEMADDGSQTKILQDIFFRLGVHF